MTIDITLQPWANIVGGLTIAILLGTWHYLKLNLAKQLADEKISHLLSEINIIHTKYKEEIASIYETNKEEKIKAIEHALDIYGKKMDEILKHNQPPPKATNALRNLYLHGRKQK
jgi:hypothetical protein